MTDRVDQMWGTDMTQTVTTGEGRAYVFIAVDQCSGELVGTRLIPLTQVRLYVVATLRRITPRLSLDCLA